MAEQSLKDKAAKGLFWGGVSNGLQQVLGMLFGIFLARILSVDDYGLVVGDFCGDRQFHIGEWVHCGVNE